MTFANLGLSDFDALVLAAKTVLIVYAHQSAGSFNAALKSAAVEVLTAQNCKVEVSDLYALNFKAPATAEDIIGIRLKNASTFLGCDYVGNDLLLSPSL